MALPFETLRSTVGRTRRAIDAGDLDGALEAIRTQITGWLSAPELTRNAVWGSRELDALAAEIGGLVGESARAALDVAAPPCDRRRPTDLYLFTRTELGGHVYVAGDLVRAAPDRTSLMVFTEQVVPIEAPFFNRLATPAERSIVLPPVSALERTQMLIALMRDVRPQRIFAFNHHYDAPIIAALAARAVPAEMYFVHHADFEPTLGLFIPDARHLDLTPRAYTFCTGGLAIESTYVPLVAADQGRRPRTRANDVGSPILATCGGPWKYDLGYRTPYPTVVAALLARTRATFYHIGPLVNEQLDAVRKSLADASVDPSRWRHIPSVPSVWAALGELGVDLYVNSFPQRGARVSVEVMGSGTPAVWHVTNPRNVSVDLHLAYPGAASWSEVDELVAIVNGLTPSWIATQGDAARAHYEATHDPALLSQLVARGFRSGPAIPAAHHRSFAFEFEHLEESWHHLTKLAARTEAHVEENDGITASQKLPHSVGLRRSGNGSPSEPPDGAAAPGIEGGEAWTASLAHPHALWDAQLGTPTFPSTVRGRLAAGYATPYVEAKFRLHENDAFFCIGSCFARVVERQLRYRNLNVTSMRYHGEADEPHLGANGANKFTTASILNELRWSLAGEPFPDEALVPDGEGYRDLQLADAAYPVSRERARERRVELLEYFGRIKDAGVVIITLGIVEVWYDRDVRLALNITPPFEMAKRFPGRFSVHTSDYAENRTRLEQTLDMLAAHGRPDLRVILTVSPVPLHRTFTGHDVLVANTYGKSTLRAVAGDVARDRPNVEYFPAYELVIGSDRNRAYAPDQVHVSDELAEELFRSFARTFGLPAEREHRLFHEKDYLYANPDVRAAVTEGKFDSGYEHWLIHGRDEGRPLRP